VALNLWKIGGQPTSFNPLPILGTHPAVYIGLKDYTIRFKAKSRLGTGSFRLVDSGTQQDILKDITPSIVFQEYEYSFKSTSENQLLQLFEYPTGSDDIIIEDIQLMQKPLPTLTVNGIDGFTSGKWALHANARVIDDETLELDATGVDQYSSLRVEVQKNTSYVISGVTIQGATNPYRVHLFRSDNSVINAVPYGSAFTTTSDTAFAHFRVSNDTTVSKFTFKKPMLNLGTTPAPYEKKRGERMVLPSVKGKNLFDGNGLSETDTSSRWSFWIPVKPNTKYSFKQNGGTARRIVTSLFDRYNGTYLGTNYDCNGQLLDKDSLNASYFKVQFLKSDGWVSLSECQNALFQLEQGTTATPYEPYAVQVNKRPMKYVPKKNLVDYTFLYDNQKQSLLNNSYVKATSYKLKPNTSYSLSSNCFSNSLGSVFLIPNGGSASSATNGVVSGRTYITQTTDNDGILWVGIRYSNPGDGSIIPTLQNFKDGLYFIQLEEGTSSTPYEPYTSVLPRAKSGLAFNGTSDYSTFSDITADEIEFELSTNNLSKIQALSHPNISEGGSLPNLNGYIDGLGKPYFFTTNTDGTRTDLRTTIPLTLGVRTKIKFSVKDGRKLFINDEMVASDNKNVTNNVFRFGKFSEASGMRFEGTLYSITCYLNGAIVAQYDAQSIVGDKLLQKRENLIPSFEDARWSLHSNFKVLGKDVGRLENGTAWNSCKIFIPVKPNTTYSVDGNKVSNDSYLDVLENGVFKANSRINGTRQFITNSTTTELEIRLVQSIAGTFEFIKPQLYQLDGKEGTLVGKPTAQLKQSRRTLYAKR
jgi:hypothetical protein